jgi:protein phosphatase 1L
MEMIDDDTDCIILASDGLWKVCSTWTVLEHSISNISFKQIFFLEG